MEKDAPRPDVERDELADVFEHDFGREFRGAGGPNPERVGDFGQRGGVRRFEEELESDLEAGGVDRLGAMQLQTLPSSKWTCNLVEDGVRAYLVFCQAEESRHGIARARERSSQRPRSPRDNPSV